MDIENIAHKDNGYSGVFNIRAVLSAKMKKAANSVFALKNTAAILTAKTGNCFQM
jgi:hypothetical protein